VRTNILGESVVAGMTVQGSKPPLGQNILQTLFPLSFFFFSDESQFLPSFGSHRYH
jgi:hypothetical protein